MPEFSSDYQKMLLTRIATDSDRDAFRALFVHYGPRIKAVMLKAGADQQLAEDLVQDVMLNVWRKSKLYSPERGAVSTWIYTIARNARIDKLRRGSSKPYEDLDDVELASEEADGEDMVIANEISGRVTDALSELPDDQRQIIRMAYIEDLSQSDIASKLSIPLGTVKSRMRLAYGKLRSTLEELR
ncbi:sigma-70 family RNA polymerase sigma factor [Roseibium sp.]|uniref:sigma-70 family RNA polymerase sigma factor n=1 Tax=Roseibium sp. TaxID=1936156 RepID=UPI0039EDEE70